MTEVTNNLLVNLFYGAWKKDENFHTEALVHLLRHLLYHEPEAAANILRQISGEALNLQPTEVLQVSIATQVTAPNKTRPDIEIKVLDYLIYIEVKVDSGLGNLQLERYRQALAQRGFANTRLILLTRYPFVLTQHSEAPDKTIRWYQIVDWLEAELDRKTIQHASSIYLVEQFLEFLQQRGVTMEHVGKELIGGIPALRSFMTMLNEALISAKILPKFDVTEDWMGYYLNLDSGQCWIGISFDWPQWLLFHTVDRIDKDVEGQINIGFIDEKDGDWNNELDLSSVEVGFFELSKTDQLKCIQQFLNESLDAVRKIQAL